MSHKKSRLRKKSKPPTITVWEYPAVFQIPFSVTKCSWNVLLCCSLCIRQQDLVVYSPYHIDIVGRLACLWRVRSTEFFVNVRHACSFRWLSQILVETLFWPCWIGRCKYRRSSYQWFLGLGLGDREDQGWGTEARFFHGEKLFTILFLPKII